jgi:hypothetical protein
VARGKRDQAADQKAEPRPFARRFDNHAECREIPPPIIPPTAIDQAALNPRLPSLSFAMDAD